MTRTEPTTTQPVTGTRAGSPVGSPSVEPVADVSGIGWGERVVVDLGPDWPALRALARFVTALVTGAAAGELLAGPAGGLAGAMTAFTAYVAVAATVTAYRNRRHTRAADRRTR